MSNENELSSVLVRFFKLLADETRLRMVGLLAKQEYNVGDLAQELDLTEPTISHHLAKLREMGMVNLRAQGNNRIYKLNMDMLNAYKGYIADLEKLEFKPVKSDNAWIDALDMEEGERDILRSLTYNGRLRTLPSKQKKLVVVLQWLATLFEADQTYTEAEVNDILKQYHPDFAHLRRYLVDFKFLQRERSGKSYWLTREEE